MAAGMMIPPLLDILQPSISRHGWNHLYELSGTNLGRAEGLRSEGASPGMLRPLFEESHPSLRRRQTR